MCKFNVKSVFLETTDRCNLRCKHCYNDSGYAKHAYLSFERIRDLITELSENNVPKISISGGEPLLHPDIRAILSLAPEKQVDIQLITNGTLLEPYIDMLCREPWVNVQISIDGPESVHDRLRGQGAFKKTDQNIRELHRRGERWSLKCTLNSYNYDYIEEIIQYGADNGAYIVSFSFLNVMGRAALNADIVLSHLQQLKACDLLAELKKKYADQIQVDFPEISITKRCPFTSPLPADGVDLSPRITVQGNVYLCSMFDNPLFALGNLNDHSLMEILRSEKTQNVLDFLTAFARIIKCERCILHHECQLGCPGTYLNRLEPYSDDFCEARKTSQLRLALESCLQ